jgi:ABC-2 type transport system permease protein
MSSWLRSLWAQVIKELLCLLRDPKTRLALFAPPLMQLLVFAFAATLEVRNVDLALLDLDRGRVSTELRASLTAAGFVTRLRPVSSREEAEALLERREVLAVLVLPGELSARALGGRGGEIQVLLDGRRANAAQILLGYLEAVTRNTGLALRPPPPQAAVEPLALRHAFNPNLQFRWYVVPGLAGILATFVTLVITALSIARERELGTFDQLLVSPASPLQIIVSKALPAVLLVGLLACLMMLAAHFGFGVPFTGSVPALLATIPLFILANVGLGLMISSLCQTQQQAILGAFAAGVPMVLMSGFATPVGNMPPLLQLIAEAIPLKHFLVIVHGSFLRGMPAEAVLQACLPLLGIAALGLGAAYIFVGRRLR